MAKRKTSAKDAEPSNDKNDKDRGIEVYKNALVRALKDGVITLEEDAILKELRKTFQISINLHKRLQFEITKKLKLAAMVKSLGDQISKLEVSLKEANESGLKVNKAEELFENAKVAYNEELYAQSKRLTMSVKKSISNAKRRVKVEVQITNVKNLIITSKKIGANVKTADRFINEAEGALDDGNFTKARKLISSARKSAQTTKRFKRENDKVKKAQAIINRLGKKGLKVKEMEKLMKAANKALKKGDSASVTKNIAKINKLASGAKHLDRAESQIKTVEFLNNETKKIGADVSISEDLIKNAKSALKENDFKRVTTYTVAARRAALEAGKIKRINNILIEVHDMIELARDVGGAVSSANRLGRQAEAALKRKDYTRASEYARRALKSASDSRDSALKRSAKSSIDNIRFLINDIKSFGLDATKIKSMVNEIEKLFKKRDYERAAKIGLEAEKYARDKLEKARVDDLRVRAEESIKAVEFVINETKEMGANVSEAESRLQDMKNMFDRGEFENIVEYVKEAEDLAKKAIDDFKLKHRIEKITDSIDATDKLIKEVKDMGIDVEEAELLLREAESMFQTNDYTEINNYLTKAHQAVDNSKQKFMQDKRTVALTTTQSIIADAVEIGADVSDASDLLKEAEALFEVEDFEAVDDYLKRAESLAKESLFQQRTQIASDAISSTKELIKETRGMGVDVSEAEELLKQVESMFKEKDFDMVDEYIKKAEGSLLGSQDHYKTQAATDAISNARELIEETRMMGINVAEADDLLNLAESMFEQQDFDAVDEYIKRSTVLVDDIRIEHREQVSTEKMTKVYKSLAEAKGLNIDSSAAEELIKSAEARLKSKDYDSVDEYLDRSETILNDLKEKHYQDNIEGEIKQVRNSISEAKELGINVDPIKELLKEAETAFEAAEYDEAEDLIKKAKKLVEDSKHDYLQISIREILDNVKSLIGEAETFGIDVTNPQKSFKQAEAFFKSRDYEKAKSFAIRAEGELNAVAKDQIEDAFPKISIDLPKEGLEAGTWNKYSFEITNEGGISAKDIKFDFAEDKYEVRGKDKIASLEVGETKTIELGVKPDEPGDIPLDMKVYYYRPFDSAEYEVEQEEQVLISSPGTYIINDAFLIYKDGILISHETREFREDMDEDIFSGMLTAVQDFIKDSFQRAGNVGLRRLDFGPNKILIERGKNIYIAIILAGAEPKFLPLFLIEIIKEIEEKFKEQLDDWNGKLDELEGIDDFIKKLLGVTVTEDGYMSDDIDSRVVPLQMLISEAKGMGTDVSDAEELLAKAESMSGEEDFETVWDYVKEAEDLVEHVKIQHYKGLAEEAFSAAVSRVDEAKNTGVDTSNFDKLIKEAKKAMELGDYDNALSLAEQCNQGIGGAEIHHEVSDLIETTRARAEEIKTQGFEIEAVDKTLADATIALETEEYDKARDFVGRAEKLLEKSAVRVDDKLGSEIESVRTLISEVEKSGVATDEAEKLLVEAEKAIEAQNYDSAEDMISQSREAASVSKQDYVQSMASKAISSLETLLADSRDEEASLDKANEYIQLAEQAYAKGDFEQADEYSRKVEEIMSRIKEDEDTKILRDTIRSTELLIEEAKASGATDTSEVEEFLNRAKSALEGREYRSAEEIAVEAETLAKSTREMVVAGQRAKGEGDEFVAPPGSPEEALVVALTGKKEVKPTDEYLTSIRDMLDKMREPYREQIALKDISSLETELEEIRGTEIDVSDIEEYIEDAKEAMENNELSKAEEYVEKAKSAIQIAKEEHRMNMITETVQSTIKFIDEASGLGADVTNAKELLELAESRVNVGDLDSAEEYLSNALNTAKEIKKEYLQRKADEVMEMAKVELAYAKEAGMKIADAEKLFKQSKVVYEEEDYETATKYANHSKELIEEAKSAYLIKSIHKSIGTIRKNCEDLKKVGAVVTEVEVLLGQATESLNKNEPETAETYIQNADVLLDEIRKPHLEQILSQMMSSVWSAIDDSKKYSADNEDILRAEELYKSAKEDFGKKDYTKAEIQLNQAEELAKQSKEEHYEKYLSIEIDKLRKKVIELKIMGIDVGEIEKSISKVEAGFDKKDYRNIGTLMKTTRGLISSVERVKYMQKASDEISFSKALIKYIKHNIKGLGSKIKSAEDLIRLAEKAFNQSNYFEAEKLAVDSKESVEHIEHPKLQQFLFVFKQLRAEEMIDETKKLFGNIRKIGINISSAEELYKKGETALRDDATYEEGRELLTQAKVSAKDVERDFHKKNASSAISAAQSLIIEVKKTGVDITEPKKFLDQGKSAYDDGEYKKSILFAGKAKMAAKKFQK